MRLNKQKLLKQADYLEDLAKSRAIENYLEDLAKSRTIESGEINQELTAVLVLRGIANAIEDEPVNPYEGVDTDIKGS